jgi:DNA-binding transcriptional regulator YdaS (Cro superfamily)
METKRQRLAKEEGAALVAQACQALGRLEELARETGVSYATLNAWCTGRRAVSPEQLVRLAEAMERRAASLSAMVETLRDAAEPEARSGDGGGASRSGRVALLLAENGDGKEGASRRVGREPPLTKQSRELRRTSQQLRALHRRTLDQTSQSLASVRDTLDRLQSTFRWESA